MKALVVPKLRSPIVLVHGLFGFNRVQVAGYTIASYFAGIVEMLEEAGNRALVPFLSPTASVAERAAQLRDFIRKHCPAEPVHVIAHSMGGLDARYMIARLGMAGHVLTLTTLGTPHRGTAFADWGIRRLERIVKPVLDFLGMPTGAFYDLTTAQCALFNREVPDAPEVRYFSVAGRHDGNFYSPEWLLPYHVVYRAEGDNDGVVAIESARYGEDLEVWTGDHMSLVNWTHPVAPRPDPRPNYAKIMCRLKDLGF